MKSTVFALLVLSSLSSFAAPTPAKNPNPEPWHKACEAEKQECYKGGYKDDGKNGKNVFGDCVVSAAKDHMVAGAKFTISPACKKEALAADAAYNKKK